MMKIACLFALLVAANGSGALAAPLPDERFASSQSSGQGTAAQRASCRPDVYRLCAGEIPNVRAIVSCLRKNRSRLSEACAAVFDAAGE